MRAAMPGVAMGGGMPVHSPLGAAMHGMHAHHAHHGQPGMQGGMAPAVQGMQQGGGWGGGA
jgi:hypothetical protein